MFLLFGILAAVTERGVSGNGQIVDAAMVDGVPAMMGLIHGWMAQSQWNNSRESNLLDGAAPFYRCYTCADGKYISVGALEPQFYAELCKITGVDPASQNDRSKWASRSAEFAGIFMTRTRDAWAERFEGTDACVAPVLDFEEAARHPVNTARHVFTDPGSVTQANPAPRFSRSAPRVPQLPAGPGAHTDEVLREIGYEPQQIADMRVAGDIT